MNWGEDVHNWSRPTEGQGRVGVKHTDSEIELHEFKTSLSIPSLHHAVFALSHL